MSTVEKLMSGKSSDVWSVSPNDTVYLAISLMNDKGVGALVVKDGDRLAGVISERDYARKVILKDRSSRQTQVKEIMTKHVYYVSPEEAIDDCLALMSSKRFRHLPVLLDNKVVGMISIGDIVKEIISEQKDKIKDLETFISWQEAY